ncbi:pyridoxal phosphate-dependent aminotransferase [Acidimicrobium ferrooxidans]|nr:pyridoxal phosphate-dependent aminotransferase [Acidimicrobium ferrooxidans]
MSRISTDEPIGVDTRFAAPTSATRAGVERGARMIGCGGPALGEMIDLGFGNPDLPPPQEALAAIAAELARSHPARYGDSAGTVAYRAGVAALYERRWGVSLDPDAEVTQVLGAKEGLHHVLAVLPPGPVGVPMPSYPTHHEAVLVAGRPLVGLELDPDDRDGRHFIERAADLARAGRVRAIVLSFPHNPTGVTTTRAMLEELVAAAVEAGVTLVHDFAYWATVLEERPSVSLLEIPEARSVAVELVSLSKSHSMAGFRAGALAGSGAIVQRVRARKRAFDHGLSQPVEAGALWALHDGDRAADELARRYRVRRDVLVAGLRRLGWGRVANPAGSMFVWAQPRGGLDDAGVTRHLVDEHGVLLGAGRDFGATEAGWLRFSLIAEPEVLDEAVRRLGQCALLGSASAPEGSLAS